MPSGCVVPRLLVYWRGGCAVVLMHAILLFFPAFGRQPHSHPWHCVTKYQIDNMISQIAPLNVCWGFFCCRVKTADHQMTHRGTQRDWMRLHLVHLRLLHVLIFSIFQFINVVSTSRSLCHAVQQSCYRRAASDTWEWHRQWCGKKHKLWLIQRIFLKGPVSSTFEYILSNVTNTKSTGYNCCCFYIENIRKKDICWSETRLVMHGVVLKQCCLFSFKYPLNSPFYSRRFGNN